MARPLENCFVLSRTDTITNEEWKELRRRGIGGSDAGTILHTNSYKSAFQLWAEKSGRVEDEFNGNEATDWGHILELPIAQRFAEVTGFAVIAFPALLQHNQDAWCLANVDFFVSTSDAWELGKVNVCEDIKQLHNVEAILEVKTVGIASRGNARAWDNDQVPTSYYWQGCHYTNVTNITKVYFAALVGGQGLQIREVNYDDEERFNLWRAEREFWQNVTDGKAPEPEGAEGDFATIKALYPTHVEGEIVEADDFLVSTIEDYKTAKASLDEQEAKVKALRASIELAIGNAEAIEHNGSTLLTYKATKPGETFDAKAFKSAHPDIAKQFTTTRPGYRVLRLKGE